MNKKTTKYAIVPIPAVPDMESAASVFIITEKEENFPPAISMKNRKKPGTDQ